MRSHVLALLFTLAVVPRPGAQAVPAPGAATAAQATGAAASARVWQGREAEFEAFLATAPFDRLEDIPLGVTHPRRGYFKPGGLAGSAAWKVIPTGRPNGFWESYKSEIAAYELDKRPELGMVPVAVEALEERKRRRDLWLRPCTPGKKFSSSRSRRFGTCRWSG